MISKHKLHFILILLLVIFTANISQAKTSTHHILINGSIRTYSLYQPPTLNDIPAPLVIVLHDSFDSAKGAERQYGWDEQANKSGLVIAYPNGLGYSWNSGGNCCGFAKDKNLDDIAFLTKLIKDVSQEVRINSKRVYITGMSNGAALAYRYACEGTYPIAAIGSVSGSMSYECKNPNKLSVIEIHGLNDKNIPFDGGNGTKGLIEILWLPVEKTLDQFRNADACEPAKTNKNGSLTTTISQCQKGREINLITIKNAGHQWPGSHPYEKFITRMLNLDSPSTAIDATATIWNFFQNHPSQQ